MSLSFSPFWRVMWCLVLLVSLPLADAGAQPAAAAASTSSPPLTDAQLAAEVGRIATAYEALGRFTGSVLIARGGREVFASGYGLADRTGRVAATPDTRFDI